MRQIKNNAVITLMAAATLCAVLRDDLHAGTSLLLVTSDFPPYVFCEKSAATSVVVPQKGIDIDIVSELFRRIGQPYSIKCLPWKRVETMVKDGEADGGFPAFRTPERESFSQFLTDPLHESMYSIFVKSGSEFPFRTLDDLAGKRIGIERSHNVSPPFHEAARAGKFLLEEASEPEQSLKKLLAGRIDAYINNYNVVLYNAKQLGMRERIAALPVPMTHGNPSYLMISKTAAITGKPGLMKRLNKALHEMWRDGTVERITGRYLR